MKASAQDGGTHSPSMVDDHIDDKIFQVFQGILQGRYP